jgi:hypothetical protein
LDAHISDATNPHTTTAAQIDSEGGANRIVTQINAGSGTIAEGRIDATIARDAEVAARFDVSSGHDHDGIDSKRIPAISSAYFSDLSGASLTSLNATQITSGTLAEARIDSTITRDSEVAARFHVTTGHNHDGANSRKLTAADVGALSTSGGGVGSTGTMSTCLRVSQTAAASACAIQGIVSAGGGPGIWWAAVAGVSDADSTAGVYASASKTYALRVEGTSYFSGAKTGYVVDLFINGDTTQLHTGDVVRLKGTPVARYHGEANKIPVTEVVRANRGSDGLVIGIVDREALPTHAGPDERKNPEDPTTIDPGGELTVVTLGAYAHCRVDATRAPISVGDLLTSSATEGCAEKATKPQLGTIIGKALEPLASGIDYIAVFVNIQ